MFQLIVGFLVVNRLVITNNLSLASCKISSSLINNAPIRKFDNYINLTPQEMVSYFIFPNIFKDDVIMHTNSHGSFIGNVMRLAS